MATHCSTLVALLLAAALLAAGPAVADDADLKSLLDGVREISAPGVPGALCCFGDEAFPVVVGNASGKIKAPVVAAARLGEGRIVALGHNGYFGQGALDTADTGRLMLNAVRWLARDAEPRVAVHGLADFAALMQDNGIAAEALEGAGWAEKLGSCNVFVSTHAPGFDDAQAAAVVEFVRGGGGFLSGDTPWGWLQLNPGKRLTVEHGGNKVLAAAGLVWADGTIGRTSDNGYSTGDRPPPLVHAARALDAVEARARGERELTKEQMSQSGWVITHAARSLLPDDELLRPRLRRLREQHAAEALPGPEKPLTVEQPLARLALTLELEELGGLSPHDLPAHRAAAAFPGSVPDDAERVSRTLEIDTSVPNWHSTGLYAAPGETIHVTVPEAAAGRGLHVRLGAHTDSLWHKGSWKRCPAISRRAPLARPLTVAANAFGGLVYIDVPKGCELGTIPVRISGAVEAPHYIHGQTDLARWRDEIRSRPAPWAELETTRAILTVPSRVVRELDDPQEIMDLWDRVLDACADLACRPTDRERAERYVTDVQISAGYMHAGYPIMTHLDVAEVVVDTSQMQQGRWGLFHETGHNHQSGHWTFGGTGEVTVNLFTMYVMETVCGIAPTAHPATKDDVRAKKTKEHLAGGADFGRWKRDPFLALIMYIQLREAFGWDAYKAVFAEYRDLPADQRPQNDDEKRDQWMVRFSRQVGHNLGPFFQAWGVPTSEQARASIADLPEWMPEGFPPE